MALIKSKNWKFGLNITYWMIGNIVMRKEMNQTEFTLYGYPNKESRNTNIRDFCESITFTIIGTNLQLSELYDFVKQPTIFEDEIIPSFFVDSIDDI